MIKNKDINVKYSIVLCNPSSDIVYERIIFTLYVRACVRLRKIYMNNLICKHRVVKGKKNMGRRVIGMDIQMKEKKKEGSLIQESASASCAF